MRASIRLGLAAFAGVLAGDACTRRVFECISEENCISRGVQGVCQESGFCSYPDDECPSDQRYDEFAGDGLAHECVPEDEGTSSNGTTSSSGVTSTDGGSSDTGGCVPECIDRDGDGYGVGPTCAGGDCDDDNPAHFDACVYVSPTGNDEADGSRDAPWLTFARAIPALGPGMSLVLLDGVYEPATTGMLHVDCGVDGNAAIGTDGAPIGVRAENERVPELASGGMTSAVSISNCGFWNLHGLRVRGGDLPESQGGAGSSVASIDDSHDIVVRRLLASHNNRHFNSNLLTMDGSSGVLVEEAELYDFQEDGVSTSGCDHVVFRRCFANSRGHPDLQGCDPMCLDHELGCCSADYYDTAFELWYGTVDSALENCIVDGPIGMAFSLGDGARNVAIRGSIVLDGSTYGAFIAATQPEIETVGNTIEDLLVIGASALGVYLRSTTDTSIRGATLLRSGTAFNADENSAPLCAELGGGCSFTAERVLAQGGDGSGFAVTAQQPWQIDSCNAFDNSTDFYVPVEEDIADDADHIRYSLSIDANIGTAVDQCAVYVPEGTPMSGAAADGSDIGATILWRIEGDITDVPLWDPATGSFPCGAIIDGANDEPTLSCAGVHTRLNVFANGCAVPAAYPPPTECE
jgi:hypothetical protein